MWVCTCHIVLVEARGQLGAISFSTMLVLEIEFRSSELVTSTYPFYPFLSLFSRKKLIIIIKILLFGGGVLRQHLM